MIDTINPEIAPYVARCDELLDDLDPPMRDQLRLDIEEIVSEVCAELGGTPEELVGPPLRFVTELRAAAGLAPPRLTAPPRQVRRWRDRVRWALSSRPAQWLRELLPELRTAWWVGRGFLVAAVLGWLTGGGRRPAWFLLAPYWRVLDSRVLGLVVLGGAIYLSVEAGRRDLSRAQRAVRNVASVTAVLMAFALVIYARDVAVSDEPSAPPFALDVNGHPGFGGVVTIGSTVTGSVREATTLEEAHAAVKDLLAVGPPATIYIDAGGRPTLPRTEAGIAAALQTLLDDGLLKGDTPSPSPSPEPMAPAIPTNP
jgi:hypothetical protein